MIIKYDKILKAYEYLLPIYQRAVKNIRMLHHATGEDKLANEVALFLKDQTEKQMLKCVWFHVPNEQIVKKVNGKKTFDASLAKKAALGTISGVADLILLGKQKCLCIELKMPNRYQSQSQKIFQQWCSHIGVPYVVCRNINEVKRALTSYNFLKY